MLPSPGVHSLQPDSLDVLGQFLPGPRLRPRQDRPGRHHRPHHGHSHGLRQQLPPQDLLHEGARHLPSRLLLHGLRGPAGVRHGQLRRQEDQDQDQETRGVPGQGSTSVSVRGRKFLTGKVGKFSFKQSW